MIKDKSEIKTVRDRRRRRSVHIARDKKRDNDRTPSPDMFSFRPHNAEDDNAPTEREIIFKDVAADQLEH